MPTIYASSSPPPYRWYRGGGGVQSALPYIYCISKKSWLISYSFNYLVLNILFRHINIKIISGMRNVRVYSLLFWNPELSMGRIEHWTSSSIKKKCLLTRKSGKKCVNHALHCVDRLTTCLCWSVNNRIY